MSLIRKFQQFFRRDPDGIDSDVTSQCPMPVTPSNRVTCTDVNESNSDMGDFSGTPIDLFDNLHSTVLNSTGSNPKTLTVHFNYPIATSLIGIGAFGGGFSNLELQGAVSDEVFFTIIDDSTESAVLQTGTYQLPNVGFNALRLIFHTTSTIEISSLFIPILTSGISRLQAVKPSGEVTDIGATNNDNLKVSVQEYGDTPSIDAFARLRVSDNFTIFDSKQLHDKQPLFWDEELGGSATSVHSSVDANVAMTVTASASDFVIRQTKQRFNYQPGKSQLILMTLYSPQVSGITNRIGLFDGTGTNNLTPNNGIFFECDGSLGWNIAKNGTITETVVQADWNVDKLDGTGASGIVLDMTATQIIIIDFEWLGVGRVRVGFVIDGLIYYCHYFNHANSPSFSSVYMSTPNLPLRYSIETDGTNGSTIDHICSTVISEGGIEKTGVLRVADTGYTHVDATTIDTTYAVVGIRLKTDYIDVTVIPESMSMINENNDDFRWSLCLNPTIAGTFTYSDLTNSAIQYAIGATANTVSDEGVVVSSGYASIDTQQTDTALNTALRIGSQIDGTRDELVLCVTPLSSGADIQAALNFRELL